MMEIGFHTDAFYSSRWSFSQCLEWAQRNGVRYVECGVIDGLSGMHGLGYQPQVALWEDPLALRRRMEQIGVSFSQIGATFPLSRPEGATLGVDYILHTMKWAQQAGCPRIATTDDRFPPRMTEREALDQMRMIYRQLMPHAEHCGITINIETQGHFTTNPEFLEEMLGFSKSPLLKVSMDLGRVGQGFLERFVGRVSHVRVSAGIENIGHYLGVLRAAGYGGVMSLGCEESALEGRLGWLRGAIH